MVQSSVGGRSSFTPSWVTHLHFNTHRMSDLATHPLYVRRQRPCQHYILHNSDWRPGDFTLISSDRARFSIRFAVLFSARLTSVRVPDLITWRHPSTQHTLDKRTMTKRSLC